MKKDSKLMILLRGIVLENPVLILILGTCPTLALTKSIVSAISMGIAATVVLICSNIVISALRKVIPDSVRIPCYIVIIAGFVTAVQMLLNAYMLPICSARILHLSSLTVSYSAEPKCLRERTTSVALHLTVSEWESDSCLLSSLSPLSERYSEQA